MDSIDIKGLDAKLNKPTQDLISKISRQFHQYNL